MPVPSGTVVIQPARNLLRHTVYDTVRRTIVRGELEPGETIREPEILTWLQVSRTPLREALKQLEAESLIVSEPNRWTRVASIVPESVIEMTAVCINLNGYAASRAAARAADPDTLRTFQRAMASVSDYGGFEEDIVLIDRGRWNEIRKFADNHYLETALQAAIGHLERLAYLYPHVFESATARTAQESTIEAIMAAKPEVAERCAREYYLTIGNAFADEFAVSAEVRAKLY